ncbi:hypothetical protein N7510_005106 [Penicillium lagena]|uniref:uncharacterized protein n=1 Tax=Penicillium lagena TaxID=94218 RepID=UPI00254226CB|nr:uncharacterized protein N7510_005106 [Penicillium lagena]KAJ5621122.1 hypothetical protein N7510_005106 [Penicillium lagena]
MEVIKGSCGTWGKPLDSDTEITDLKDSIEQVAGQTGVDSRFILAIVLQESNGCVRVPTTDNGVTNPGLMQSHDGSGSCNNGNTVLNPCPKSQIYQMIYDGTAGTSSGDGLKQCLAQATGSGATQYYQAARIYNSGSLAASGNLGQGVQRPVITSSPAPSPTETVPATSPTETVPATSPTETPSPTTTNPDPSTGSSAPAASVYPYAASPCQKYHTVQSGDYCDKVATDVGITFSQLRQWNSGLDAECSNLWLGYQYCVLA